MVCNDINNNILEAIYDTLINKGYTKSAGLLKICVLMCWLSRPTVKRKQSPCYSNSLTASRDLWGNWLYAVTGCKQHCLKRKHYYLDRILNYV